MSRGLLIRAERFRRPAANPCPGSPDALGTKRPFALDASISPRVARKQFPDWLPTEREEVVLMFDDGPWPTTKPGDVRLAQMRLRAGDVLSARTQRDSQSGNSPALCRIQLPICGRATWDRMTPAKKAATRNDAAATQGGGTVVFHGFTSETTTTLPADGFVCAPIGQPQNSALGQQSKRNVKRNASLYSVRLSFSS
jgi:hypothetical protein